MDSSEVARLCCDFYAGLPKKGKPLSERNEWTVMSAFVLRDSERNRAEVVALGTGTKCLGASEVAENGTSLNDSHAEVVARRALMLYLIDQLKLALGRGKAQEEAIFAPSAPGGDSSPVFQLRQGIEFHFYSSHPPCGDASIMSKGDGDVESSLGPSESKKSKTDDVHRTGAKCLLGGAQDTRQPGSEYHVVGPFRTKPGRGEPTSSLSCSDKLAKWMRLGVQGTLISRFLARPIHVKSITIGHNKGSSAEKSLTRALYGRFCDTGVGRIDISVEEEIKFPHARVDTSGDPSSGSIIWYKGLEKPEVVVNGYKLGATKKVLGTVKAAACVSPIMIFKRFCQLLISDETSGNRTYSFLREKQLARDYGKKWSELKSGTFAGWPCKSRKFDLEIEA